MQSQLLGFQFLDQPLDPVRGLLIRDPTAKATITVDAVINGLALFTHRRTYAGALRLLVTDGCPALDGDADMVILMSGSRQMKERQIGCHYVW
jgi:hypothetical protein